MDKEAAILYSFSIKCGKFLGECIYKLEIWGRAQLEATRRPKSNWKYNLWG